MRLLIFLTVSCAVLSALTFYAGWLYPRQKWLGAVGPVASLSAGLVYLIAFPGDEGGALFFVFGVGIALVLIPVFLLGRLTRSLWRSLDRRRSQRRSPEPE